MRSFHKYTCWLNLVLSAAHYIKNRTNIADVCDCLKIDICSLKAIHPACSSCMFYSSGSSVDPIVVFSIISYGTRTPVRRLRIRYLSHLARHCLFLLCSCFLLNLPAREPMSLWMVFATLFAVYLLPERSAMCLERLSLKSASLLKRSYL